MAGSLSRAFVVAVASALLAVVVPGAQEGHAASAYRLSRLTLPDGRSQVARWDPCQSAITFKVNVAKVRGAMARQRAIAVTKASVARIERASGLDLAYRGTTTWVPRRDNLTSQNTAEIVVAFVPPSATDHPLAGSVAGYGGWSARIGRTSSGSYSGAITRGFVVVDHAQTRRWPDAPRRRGVTRANLVSHELAHAVGLQHVHSPSQLMNPALTSASPAGFAEGDRLGLRRVGAPAGCLDTSGFGQDLD